MECLECEHAMERYEYGGVVVDACPSCSSLWFDSGELKPFVDRVLRERAEVPFLDYETVDEAIGTDDIETAGLPCPRCDDAMGPFNYGYDSNILMDRCARCGGLWVTGEALRRLMRFVKGNPAGDRLAHATAGFMREAVRYRESYEALGGAAKNAGLRIYPSPSTDAKGMTLPPSGGPPPVADARGEIEFRSLPAPAPWMTLALMALNVSFFAMFALRGADGDALLIEYGLVAGDAISGDGLATVLSYMVLHPTAVQLLLSVGMLWFVGTKLESDLGRLGLLSIYLCFGVLAGAVHVLLHSNDTVAVVGAGGALAGLLGWHFALSPNVFARSPRGRLVWFDSSVLFGGIWFVAHGSLGFVLGPFDIRSPARAGGAPDHDCIGRRRGRASRQGAGVDGYASSTLR